jgi:hypothetical protein
VNSFLCDDGRVWICPKCGVPMLPFGGEDVCMCGGHDCEEDSDDCEEDSDDG